MLTTNDKKELDYMFEEYQWDSENWPASWLWGVAYHVDYEPLIHDKLVARQQIMNSDGDIEDRCFITQAGANYLGKDVKIVTPFDKDNELTAARAEIARLTTALEASERANAELTEKLKIADAGWAECMGSGRNPWSTAQEFKRRQNDIRKRYRGE